MPDVKVLRVDNADVERPDFDIWKEELPYTDKKEDMPLLDAAQDTENLPECDKDYVLRKISTFPVESMTPFDCMLFIMEMKDFINSLINGYTSNYRKDIIELIFKTIFFFCINQ